MSQICPKCVPNMQILVRHGESLGNVDSDVYFNTPDNLIPLTNRGEEEAREAGKKIRLLLNGEKIRFYVSPFKRTVETFKEISKELQKKQILSTSLEPRLREQEWGFLPNREEFNIHKRKRFHVGRFFFRFGGGESGADVYDRITSFMNTMFRDFARHRAQNVGLVSHGFTCRIFVMRYFHIPYEVMESWSNLENGEVIVLEKERRGKYELTTPLRTHAERRNYSCDKETRTN
eukprot:GHVR01042463.1.p1 GENE.GHVR01042463.1~~GHVR01042463.1.p1  ORF type:complete len:233 (-),score=41.48 GHVR01042463.1:354-1052(-)